jgi:hypothetical protein
LLLVTMLLGASFLSACRSDDARDEVEMHVRGVMIDPAARAPVVMLEDRTSGAELPIWMGAAEARAIAMQLEGVESPRPMTHDLIKSLLDRTGVRFERVVIHALHEGTYFARIFLTARGDDLEIDSRPSDAIALAVRFEKPVFVARSLLRTGGAAASAPPGEEALTVAGITVQALSRELAEHFDIVPGGGVLVSAVAAEAAGDLQPGDVILTVDDEAVRDPVDFAALVSDAVETMDLSVQRGARRIHVALDPVDE